MKMAEKFYSAAMEAALLMPSTWQPNYQEDFISTGIRFLPKPCM